MWVNNQIKQFKDGSHVVMIKHQTHRNAFLVCLYFIFMLIFVILCLIFSILSHLCHFVSCFSHFVSRFCCFISCFAILSCFRHSVCFCHRWSCCQSNEIFLSLRLVIVLFCAVKLLYRWRCAAWGVSYFFIMMNNPIEFRPVPLTGLFHCVH